MTHSARSLCLIVLLPTLLCMGCGSIFRYSTDSVRHRTLAGARPTLVEPIDANPLEHPEVAAVRESVTEHFTRAEVAGRIVAAPVDEASMNAILDEASRAGEEEVVFVRWLTSLCEGRSLSSALAIAAPFAAVPYLILNSIPMNHHSGSAFFEIVVVQPRTHEILLRRSHLATFAEPVSGWGYGPTGVMQEMMRTSVEALIDDLVQARDAGYPERTPTSELATVVLRRGTYMLEESGDLVGPGFAVRPPPGAEMLEPGEALARYDLGHQATFTVYWDATDTPEGYVNYARSQLAKTGGEIRVSELEANAHDLRVDVEDGEVVVYAMAQGGMGYRFECDLPEASGHEARDACFAALGSVRLESITRE